MVQQRLPSVNSDDGSWGDILNQFLSKEHYNSGADLPANGGHQHITLLASTGAANTAPITLTAGTNLTTAAAGTVEYDGAHFYLTPGSTRNTIATYATPGTKGDTYYNDGSGNFTPLTIGGTGNLLTVNSGGLPVWTSAIAESSVTNLTTDLAAKALTLTPTAIKTTAYTAVVGDFVVASAAAGAFTVTLPTAPADKSRILVKKIDVTANAVTIARGGSDVFNVASGATSLTLNFQFQEVELQYYAASSIWYVTTTDAPLNADNGSLKSVYGRGGNMVSDSGFEVDSEWANAFGVQSTALYYSGTKSRLITSTGSGPVTDRLTFNHDSLGNPEPIVTPELSAFYLECTVYRPSSNTSTGSLHLQVRWIDTSGTDHLAGETVWPQSTLLPANAWTTISIDAYSAVVGASNVATVYACLGIDATVPSGDKFYVDRAYMLDCTDSIDKIDLSYFSHIGDLIVGAGSSLPATLGVGADTTVLTADSTQTYGVKWASAPPSLSTNAKQSVRASTQGTETFTIVSGSVTQINGTSLDTVPLYVGDRILVKDAPAASGVGSAGSQQPGNGIYVVTGNTTNLTVTRAADMSGSVVPNGSFTFIEAGNGSGGWMFGVSYPYVAIAFTYGTTAMQWTYSWANTNTLINYINTAAAIENNKTMTWAAGTTAIAPMKFLAGTNLTTPAAGAMEFDGSLFYLTAAASTRQVVQAEQFITLTTAYTLTSQTAAQKLFNATATGAVTLPVGTYFFDCFYTLSSMSATSGSFGWTLAVGTATIAGILWQSEANKAALATAASAQNTTNTAANTAIVTANTTTTGWAHVWGKVRISAAGTVIPEVSLGVAAAAVVGTDSFFRIWAIGSNTVTNVGNWS